METKPSFLGKSLKKESVTQSIINCLVEGICNHEIKPGEQIPTDIELASSFGVALSSVREAVLVLCYLGVLERKPSGGTFVCSGFQECMIDPILYIILLNQESVVDLIELYQMLENGYIDLAIGKASDEELKEMKKMLDEMMDVLADSAFQFDSAEDFLRLDEKFHNLIMQIGENCSIAKMIEVIRTITHGGRYNAMKKAIESEQKVKLISGYIKLCKKRINDFGV